MEQKPPDWTISELYQKAWFMVRNNKILWLFALAFGGGLMSGSGSSNSSSSGGSSSTWQFFQNFFQNHQQSSKVLGDATSSTADIIFSVFSGIPFWLIALIGFELFFLLFIIITTFYIYQNWAHAALIETIETISNGGKATIRDSSEKAFRSILPVMQVTTIPSGIFFAILIAELIITILSAFFAPTLFFFMALVIFTYFLIFGIFILLNNIIAPRVIVLEKKQAKEAFLESLEIIKQKKYDLALVGLINGIMTWVISVIVAVVSFGIILSGAFIFLFGGQSFLTLPFIIFVTIPLVLYLVGYQIADSIVGAFKACVWSLAFSKLRRKPNGN